MSLLRSTTTGSGLAKAACTAATASGGVRPPTRTPATRTPTGTVERGGGVAVVVVVTVVVAGVVDVTVVAVVVPAVVVMSAITGLDSAPAAASPSTNKQAASRRFTPLA